MTVSDARGYFALDALPIGEYIVQAHLNGFAGSSRERVQVGAASPAVHRFQLRKLDAPVGTTGRRRRSRPGRSWPPDSSCPDRR